MLFGVPAILVLLLIAGALAWHFGGATWVVNRILRGVNPYPGHTLAVARVSGNPFGSLELDDVRLVRGDIGVLARLDSARIRYDPWQLVGDTIRIADVRVYGPWVDLRRLPNSSWNLAVPRRPKVPSKPSNGPRIAIDHVVIAGGAGQVSLDEETGRGLNLEAVNVEARKLAIAKGVRIDQATVRLRVQLRPRPLEWVTVEARGSLRPERIVVDSLQVRSPGSAISARGSLPLPRPFQRTEGLAIHVDARPLALRDLGFFGTRFERPESAVLTLDARGEQPGIALRLSSIFSDSSQASVEGLVTMPGQSPLAYRANATLRALDLGLLTGKPSRGDRVNGRLAVDVQGTSANRLDGRVRAELQASRYGSFRLRRATGTADFSTGRARLDVALESGPIGATLTGWLRPFDSVPSYDVTARAERLRADSTVAWLDRLVGTSGTRFSVRLTGRGFDPRHADAQALVTTVPGGGPPGLIDSATISARVTAGTARVQGRVGAAGGLVDVLGEVALDQELRYRVRRGSVAGLDLGAILGSAAESSVDGTFSLRGRGTKPASADLRGDLQITRLSYGPHLLTDARLAVGLARGAADLTLHGIADGTPIELAATARPFDPEPTLSVTRLQFRHADVARFAPAARVATDLSGSARLRLRGRRLDALHATAAIALDSSRVADRSIDQARMDASFARGSLDLRLRLNGPAGSVALAAGGRPLDSVPSYVLRDATFEDLDLGLLMPSSGLRSRLAGSLRLEGNGRRPETARLTGMLTLEPSTFNRASIQSGHLEVGLADGRLQVVGRVMGDRDSVTLDATAEPFATPPHLRLTSIVGSGDLAALLGRDTIPGTATVTLAAEGTGRRPAELRLVAAVDGKGQYGGVAVDTLRSRLRFADGTLHVDTLSLESNVGAAGGAGRIALPLRELGDGSMSDSSRADTSAFRLAAELRDLSPLGPILGVEGLGLDTGIVSIALHGPRDHLHVIAGVQGTDLAWGPHRLGAMDASLEGELAADRSIRHGTGQVLLQGLSLSGRRIARLDIRGGYADRALSVHGDVDVDRVSGATVAARVFQDSAERRIELDTLNVKGERDTWALSHPVRLTWGQRLAVNDFALTSGGRRVAVDGTLDRQGEQRLAVRIDSLPLGWLGKALGVGSLDGKANGSLDLTGPAAAPRLTGNVALQLTSRSKKVGAVRGRVDWTGPQGLQVDLGLYHPKGDSLLLAGHIPLALSLGKADSSGGMVRPIPDGKLALDLTARGFGIDFLNPVLDPATIKDVRGRLTADAHAGGSLKAPALAGTLELTDASMRLSRLGAKYEKGRLRTALEGREIRLTEAHLVSGGGRVDAQGAVQFPPSSTPELDLAATLDNFRVADGENLRSTASGSVHLGGTPAAPSLDGSVSLKNTDFYLQAQGGGQSAEDVELTDEDLRTVHRRFALTVERSTVKAPSPWGLALDVDLSENDWLRRRTSPAVAVELTGKLQVRKEPGEDLLVYGSIKPIAGRSFVEMLGRRFDVKKGEVGLNGPIANAKLDIQAEYQADSGSSTSPRAS